MITFMQNASGLDKKVAKAFNYRCIIDFKRFVHIHHIVPKSLGGESLFENLVPLCLECHRRIHNTGAINWVGYLTDLREKRLHEFAYSRKDGR
jgi:hypothetical protein